MATQVRKQIHIRVMLKLKVAKKIVGRPESGLRNTVDVPNGSVSPGDASAQTCRFLGKFPTRSISVMAASAIDRPFNHQCLCGVAAVERLEAARVVRGPMWVAQPSHRHSA